MQYPPEVLLSKNLEVPQRVQELLAGPEHSSHSKAQLLQLLFHLFLNWLDWQEDMQVALIGW